MESPEYPLMVGDLMTIEPVVVTVDAPIEEAHRLMLDFRVSGLPVVDESASLVGVVSQTDLMHLDTPDVHNVVHHKPSGIRVGEVMTHPPITVELTTPLVEAARKMVDQHVHRVVVVDQERRAIGVLSAMDFVQLYAEQ